MRAVNGTAGVAWVELMCPQWGVPFCKHRSCVARSTPCRERSFCPSPSVAWSQEASRARTAAQPRPQLSLSFSGVPE